MTIVYAVAGAAVVAAFWALACLRTRTPPEPELLGVPFVDADGRQQWSTLPPLDVTFQTYSGQDFADAVERLRRRP